MSVIYVVILLFFQQLSIIWSHTSGQTKWSKCGVQFFSLFFGFLLTLVSSSHSSQKIGNFTIACKKKSELICVFIYNSRLYLILFTISHGWLKRSFTVIRPFIHVGPVVDQQLHYIFVTWKFFFSFKLIIGFSFQWSQFIP